MDEKDKTGSTSRKASAERAENDCWRALCAFLLVAEEPIAFLRAWNEGSFEVCRREWPEAPEAVYPVMPGEAK